MTPEWLLGWQAGVEAVVAHIKMCQRDRFHDLELWTVEPEELSVTELSAMWLALLMAAEQWRCELEKREPDE